MKTEEELQQAAEDSKHLDIEKGDLNAKAYVDVFKALTHIPDYIVPVNFAENVMEKIKTRQQLRPSIFSSDYFLLSAGLILLLALTIAAITLTNFKIDMGFLNAMSPYKNLLIFGVTFIVILNMLDKQLIRKRS